MDLDKQFEQAVAVSKTLPEKPSNDILLQLYALYKQSVAGDVDAAAPDNPFDFVGKAKYDAWAAMKGKSKEAAMREYVELVQRLQGA